MDDMEIATNKSMAQRLCNFVVALGVAVLFVYVFLPYLTRSFGVLNQMSQYLDDNGIDPSRYYYTDVEQVQEAEQYLDSVLELD